MSYFKNTQEKYATPLVPFPRTTSSTKRPPKSIRFSREKNVNYIKKQILISKKSKTIGDDVVFQTLNSSSQPKKLKVYKSFSRTRGYDHSFNTKLLRPLFGVGSCYRRSADFAFDLDKMQSDKIYNEYCKDS